MGIQKKTPFPPPPNSQIWKKSTAPFYVPSSIGIERLAQIFIRWWSKINPLPGKDFRTVPYVQELSDLLTLDFNKCPPPPNHTSTLPTMILRAFSFVHKLSELLRLDFNICHMFGRYDRLMWIARVYYNNKLHRSLFFWVSDSVHIHIWFHQN